ncbi:hypothetical protein N7509_000653 [Penicillium cosmopolitanum]|uniref:Uncharacterized protein n=1 Tax=Penicillium cosmopolitanum TaxID=1131564 RepID=A0A9W9WB02_9EURO|nr:uncharacterized protein N7509_000653 [Penicillium cosmopolitanum]KAJ5414026.1 hypothetical protein N7509_000653 [Penicillium cosmopolitanum]
MDIKPCEGGYESKTRVGKEGLARLPLLGSLRFDIDLFGSGSDLFGSALLFSVLLGDDPIG